MRDWEITPYKKGRRLYGHFYKDKANGQMIYLARRRPSEVYRCGQPTVSDAERAGVACWAIDDDDLREFRARGVKFVGIRVVDGSTVLRIFITPIETFFDTTKVTFHNYEKKNGSRQRRLSYQHFAQKTCI